MSVVLPASSAIPGALAQFLVVAGGALPTGTTVWFGAELSTYSTPLTLQVTEISGGQSPAELGPAYRREETFSLVCTLSAYQGGTPDFPGQLTVLMQNFALLSAAVASNPSLNGSVRLAQVTNFLISPVTDPGGTGAVTLDFQVRCAQRIRSLDSQ